MSLIKFKSKDGTFSGEAMEFTGNDSNYEEIELWSDRRVAIKGIKLQPSERELEIQILGREIRAEVGAIVLKIGDIFTFISKDTFVKRYEAIEGNLTRRISSLCSQYNLPLVLKFKESQWFAEIGDVTAYENNGDTFVPRGISNHTPNDALNELADRIENKQLVTNSTIRKKVDIYVQGIERV